MEQAVPAAIYCTLSSVCKRPYRPRKQKLFAKISAKEVRSKISAVREKDARAALLPRAFQLKVSYIVSRPCWQSLLTPIRVRTQHQRGSRLYFKRIPPSDLPSHVIFGVAFRNEHSQYIAITQKTENHTQKYDSTAGAAQGNFEAT
jgi:hypothetical protein